MSDEMFNAAVLRALRRLLIKARWGFPVKLADVVTETFRVLQHDSKTMPPVRDVDRMVDRALQAHRRAGLIEYRAKRDPKTQAIRPRWGWMLTDKGRR